MKKSPLPLPVGASFVFFRDGHDWHGCEVSVLSVKGGRHKVARCCDVADALLSPRGSKKRKIKTWSAKREELW